MVPCAVAHAAKTITINTNTAGELADACGVKPGDSGADTKRTFCQGFAQGAISVELRHAGQNKPFCFPRPAPSRAETMKQFVDWVGAMPSSIPTDRRERICLCPCVGRFEVRYAVMHEPTLPGNAGGAAIGR